MSRCNFGSINNGLFLLTFTYVLDVMMTIIKLLYKSIISENVFRLLKAVVAIVLYLLFVAFINFLKLEMIYNILTFVVQLIFITLQSII